MAGPTTQTPTRRKRSDGERSRAAILEAAARLATVDGLDGLSIGRLAGHIGMSKSGLYAHFGSKQELQLETVGTAETLFEADVVRPAERVPAGLERLDALCEGFMRHVESGVFPGGCFFTSVLGEFDTRPGPVRDRVAEYVGGWLARLRAEVVAAQDGGRLDPGEDPDQIVFEIQSALLLANTLWVITADPAVFDRARAAIGGRIARSRRD
jgi:AcrR family transcriptional regulator